MREKTAAALYLLPHERLLAERQSRRERAGDRPDATRAQGEVSVEAKRLDAAYSADMYLGSASCVAGVIAGLIIGKGFGALTAGLDTAYCLLGIGFALGVLSGVRLAQSMLLQRGHSRG